MKAVRVPSFGGSEVLEVVEVDEPNPSSGEVIVDVRAIGINFAEIMQRRGDYFGGPEPPYVPGAEAAGVIEAVGPDVDREVGERVAVISSTGAYAEKVVAPSEKLFDVPAGMDFSEAAGFPVQFLTAHAVLFEWGRLAASERVLIHAAAGGVGTAAVQLASHAGATVFGTASSDAKLELASRLGCDYTINYTDTDFSSQVTSLTDDEGVDVVLDGVGGEVFKDSLDVLSRFGRLVTYGVASGRSLELDPRNVFFENRSVHGFHLGHAFQHAPERIEPSIAELSELLQSGAVEVVVGERFPLEEVAAAHRHIESRGSSGKVVLIPE